MYKFEVYIDFGREWHDFGSLDLPFIPQIGMSLTNSKSGIEHKVLDVEYEVDTGKFALYVEEIKN